MGKKDREKKQEIRGKKFPWYFYGFLLLMVFLGIEGIGQLVYKMSFNEKEDLLYRAFLGLGSEYNPNMVSNYVPHHFLNYVLNPNVQFHYKDYFGTKPVHFINKLGFRGKEFTKEKQEGVYRIICVGGSTTFSLTEPDERRTYPQMLEDALNQTYKSPKFEVINAGTPGWSSAESFINFHFRLLDYKPDMAIVYHAVNDAIAMRYDEEGKSDYSGFRRRVDYQPVSEWVRPFLRTSAFLRLIYYHTHVIARDINSLAVLSAPSKERIVRNLQNATGKYYRMNIDGIVISAIANQIVPVLMTMGNNNWHPSLEFLNQISRDIAKNRGAVLVDFSKLSQPHFFASDGVHLTQAGNLARVSAIVETLKKLKTDFVLR